MKLKVDQDKGSPTKSVMSSNISRKGDGISPARTPKLNGTEVSYDNDRNVDNAGVQRKNFMEAFGDT